MRLFAVLIVLMVTPAASAQCPKCGQYHYPYDQPVQVNQSVVQVNQALAEVNRARTRKRLRPFKHDPLLTIAAERCAKIRAARRIQGHLPNDFKYLPPGATAKSAGCGALEPSWGWGACCTYENYTYAGAAIAWGSDGKRYMHLFVR